MKLELTLSLTCLAGGPGSGANAWLLSDGSVHILLDAGAESDGSAPWLDSLEHAPDAVFITHAHWDHAGALPRLMERFGVLPVFATPTTKRLIPFLLTDVLGQTKAKSPKERATAIRDTMQSLEFHQVFEVGGFSCEMIPSGHLQGASMLRLRHEAGGLLYTSDMCLHPQASVAGADLSDCDMPWVLEAALATTAVFDGDWETEAKEKLARGLSRGSCLIGVSPLGNLVELLAQIQGTEFVVYDGLKPVLKAWRADVGVDFRNQEGCKAALLGGMCVLAPGVDYALNGIAGQLALEILGNSKASIVATRDIGFGRKLIRTPRRSKLQFGGQAMRLKAHVEWVRLPNHTTRKQLIQTVLEYSPSRIFLTHGNEDSLFQLKRKIQKAGYEGEVEVAELGKASAFN